MSQKTKIILLSVILSVFVIAIVCIAIFHKRPVEDEPSTSEHNYAYNEVKDREDIKDPVEEENPEETEVITEKMIQIGDINIYHAERLTNEQAADKSSMISKLHGRVASDEESYGKISSEEILETSNMYQVYVETTFEDGTKKTYVCSYDATKMHSFLRCVSLEEWEYYESGANAG